MTECADMKAKRALEALFRGELDAEGFTRLRAHAATCPSCREAYDRLSRVESTLEQRALPENRQALLEGALFARLGVDTVPTKAPVQAPVKAQPVRTVAPPERASFFRPWMGASLGFAVAAGLAVLVLVPRSVEQDPRGEWQPRSTQAGSAWGVRAFCVGADGQVRGEARPGGTLACGEGDSVQFSYTAPEGARLSIEAAAPSGEPLRFFPSEGPTAPVASGVDVPLPYSTPVRGGWLRGALDVRARFVDEKGQPLGETRLTLTPR